MEENNTSNATHESQAENHSQTPHQQPPKLPSYSKLPQIETPLEELFGQKAPQLPEGWRHSLAGIAPWITLIGLVLTLPGILAIFGFSFYVLPSMLSVVGYSYGMWGYAVAIISLVSLVFEAMALPGLFNRSKQGWVYIFYAVLLSGLASLVGFNIGGLIGTAIFLYLIFQIKNQYK